MLIKAIFDTLKEYWYFPVGLTALAMLKVLLAPKIKGAIGEKTVNHFLKKLPRKEYKVLNDILISTESGTSQIDHIVISKYGVFIIETKAYTGWIYGKEKDKTWTQNIYGNKNYFQNPIHQNYGHIKRLEELNPIFKDIDLISIVAFSGECELKSPLNNVVYFKQIPSLIKSYKEVSLSKEETELIYNIIESSNLKDRKSRREHVNKIRETVKP